MTHETTTLLEQSAWTPRVWLLICDKCGPAPTFGDVVAFSEQEWLLTPNVGRRALNEMKDIVWPLKLPYRLSDKRGPKPKPVSEVKRNNFTFRMCDELRAKVLALSEKSGRPMSEEVEARLVASFDQPALIDALASRLASNIEQASEWEAWGAISDALQGRDRFVS